MDIHLIHIHHIAVGGLSDDTGHCSGSRDSYTQRIFQLLLNYTIHPKPKVCSCVCFVSSFMLNYPHNVFVTDAATLIGASLSEPHTSELRCVVPLYIIVRLSSTFCRS